MRRSVATAALAAFVVGGATFSVAPVMAQDGAPPTVEAAQDAVQDAAREAGVRVPERRAIVRVVLSRAAEAIGLPVKGLVGQMRGGASMAEVAERQGVSAEDVVSAIVDPTFERLDAAVASGRLDAVRIEALKAKGIHLITWVVDTRFDIPTPAPADD